MSNPKGESRLTGHLMSKLGNLEWSESRLSVTTVSNKHSPDGDDQCPKVAGGFGSLVQRAALEDPPGWTQALNIDKTSLDPVGNNHT